MSEIRRISDFQHELSFFNAQENFDIYYQRFLSSDLGKIHRAIPFEDLTKHFKLKEKPKGTKNLFSPKGKVALMFLKHYAACSDKKLIEQLNGNINYQFFCDIYIGTNSLLNYKIVSQIRCELSHSLNIPKIEKELFSYWSPYIKEQQCVFTDATCYESEVRFPTNQKLLWEAVQWTYHQTKTICKHLKIKLPRTKFLKWEKRYINYSKMRRKTKKKRNALTRALLLLLNKLNKFLNNIKKRYTFEMPNDYHKRRATIKKIHSQQYGLFHNQINPKNRIVSIAKNYLRPIVRGKEIKGVEFGAKLNKLQIDGINFIQKISFDNFNEGTQFKNTIYKAQGLTRKKVKIKG